jgi:hypothetical protein
VNLTNSVGEVHPIEIIAPVEYWRWNQNLIFPTKILPKSMRFPRVYWAI